VLHGSQSAATEWLRLQRGHLAVARRRENCWYGVVEQRGSTRRVFGRKCLWVPNAFHAPFAWPLWPLGERPAVSIDCANRLLKNIPNQIVATALAARHRDLTLKLFIDRPEQLESLLLDCGVEYEIILPKPWQQHVDEISTSVDVGLQCSFSESFNYTCLEHLYAGKPVVGSRAIAFCPWQVDDPDDPEAIARLLLDVLNRYDECSVEARERAVEVIARNNAALVDVVDGLLVGEEVHCG
jgi:glycosyltransferase involved in cell wall biosynthesis